MKKLYFLVAVTALMFAACSSENDILQDVTRQTQVEQGVGFDVYVPSATVTRAGLEGTMTTGRLQRSEYEGGGFGVYAYLTEDVEDGAGATGYSGRTTAIAPDFMVNEKILWNPANQGWYYNPLKYWPNETNNDSQSSNATMENGTKQHLDRLTFFAYAPYVASANELNPGITAVTNNQGKLSLTATTNPWPSGGLQEASIRYKASLDDPNKAVDLLWGVAPAGGLTYTAVNGKTVSVPEGMPLIDMTKPNVNTNMKFLFQHSLARIGIKAVAAIDQISPGGALDPNTRITIQSIKLTGYFGGTGLLNLDNISPNVAKWETVNGKTLKSTVFGDLAKTTLTVSGEVIAEHLRYISPHTLGSYAAQTDRVGVTTVRQDVLEPATIDNTAGVNRNWYTVKRYAANELAYSETTPYYSDAACTVIQEVAMPSSYTIDSKGVFTDVAENTGFAYPMVLQNYAKGEWHTITAEDESAKTYDNYQAYSTNDEPLATKPAVGAKVIENGIVFIKVTSENLDEVAGLQAYTYSDPKYTPKPVGQAPAVGDYVIGGTLTKAIPYYPANMDLYKRDPNYFMVVPTNNFINENSALSANEEELRTVTVEIEYYITTEDASLLGKRTQTKNVVTKDVVFPSIANGKSYNLILVLGLTSVKLEAEVDDWKVINVQADVPQNTAD